MCYEERDLTISLMLMKTTARDDSSQWNKITAYQLMIGTSVRVIISMKSSMKGDFHVRFCGNVGVKFLRVTRLAASDESAVNI